MLEVLMVLLLLSVNVGGMAEMLELNKAHFKKTELNVRLHTLALSVEHELRTLQTMGEVVRIWQAHLNDILPGSVLLIREERDARQNSQCIYTIIIMPAMTTMQAIEFRMAI